MPRTVRISPVPIPPPPVAPRTRRRAVGPAGVALLVLAALAAVGYVLASGDGSHSWDRHGTPPATVRLTAGVSYSLATTAGPGVSPAPEPLTCTYAPAGSDTTTPIAVTEEGPDTRATHVFARFTGPVSGEVTVTCRGGKVGSRPVFVDDADDAAADLGGMLLVVCAVAATAGAGLTLGALYARSGRPSGSRVSGVTGDPDA